jgi:hypothetical protein
MNATQLFKQAKSKADQLPMIVRTTLLISSVMLADVAQWVSNQDYSMSLGYNGDKAVAIRKTANDAIDMIGNYMREEIL